MVTMELQRHGLMGQKGYHIQMLIMVVLKEHRAGAPLRFLQMQAHPSNGRCMAVDYDDISISGIPASTAGNSSGSDGSSDASISGGGCGFINDGTGKSGSNAVQIFIFFLPLILIRLWRLLLKKGEWNY